MDQSIALNRAEVLSHATDFVAIVARAAVSRLPVNDTDHDDLFSDLVFKLWKRGCMDWPVGATRAYARKASHRQDRTRHSAYDENDNGEPRITVFPGGSGRAMQEINYNAMIARGLLAALPEEDRQVLSILADGGDPLDVARELDMPAREAIDRIRRARYHVGLVDPI